MPALLPAVTSATNEALDALRDPSTFHWYTVTLLLFVVYVYAQEVERRRWDIVLAGLALWLMDWFNEIVNALILHFTDTAPLWAVTGDSSYVILVGLNIEIVFMFAVMGIVYVKMLPADRRARILGIPNRLVFALVNSCIAVGIEILLVQTGYFHWHYWFWRTSFPVLIVVFGYLTFFLVAGWVFDMRSRRRQLATVGALAGLVGAMAVAFGPILEWI